MQKNVKADVPSRAAMCLFTKRRKLAFGSDSSTFFFAHIRTSGYPSRRVGLSVLCKHKNGNVVSVELFRRGVGRRRACMDYWFLLRKYDQTVAKEVSQPIAATVTNTATMSDTFTSTG